MNFFGKCVLNYILSLTLLIRYTPFSSKRENYKSKAWFFKSYMLWNIESPINIAVLLHFIVRVWILDTGIPGCHDCSHQTSLPKNCHKPLQRRRSWDPIPSPKACPSAETPCWLRQQDSFARAPSARCCSIAHRSPARGSAALPAGSGRVEGGSNLSAGAFQVAWPPHSFSPVFLYPGSNRSLWLRRPLWGNSSHRRLPGLPGGGSGRTLRSLLWQ